jgi:hypothetical protein
MSSRCTNRPTSRVTGSQRDAFVLVMVLALLTVCALCLAGLARRGLDASEQVASAQSDTQRRWGILSCERTYLPLAKDLMEGAAAKLPAQGRVWPLPSSVSAQFDLGELHFSVLLADEDAKANLNTIARSSPDGPRTVASLLEETSAGFDGLVVNVQPLAIENTAPGKSSNQVRGILRSWGQVFEPSHVVCPGDYAARVRDATRNITCWGSGRLNLQRASDEAIRLVCGNQITPDLVNKLIAHRHEPDVTGLEALLESLALRKADRATLERLLTDRSSRYSLWITVQNPRRRWATLAIGDGSSSQSLRESFTW